MDLDAITDSKCATVKKVKKREKVYLAHQVRLHEKNGNVFETISWRHSSGQRRRLGQHCAAWIIATP